MTIASVTKSYSALHLLAFAVTGHISRILGAAYSRRLTVRYPRMHVEVQP